MAAHVQNARSIPPDCLITFVGEGAANIVFKVDASGALEETKELFEGQLLRAPKAGTSAYSHQELQDYWENRVKPLFEPGDLVEQSLVRMAGSDLVQRLNAVLAEKEGRRADFKDSQVADVDFAMLVEDMTQREPDELALEFKPKWLDQAPDAPPDATRCRNCAREAYRNNKMYTSDVPLCPLELIACRTTSDARDRVLTSILGQEDVNTPLRKRQKERLGSWLQTNELIPRLHNAQRENRELPLIMTLRDCTCFLRIPADEGRPVEAKLADLDKKNEGAKAEYWKKMGERLRTDGYYWGREVPAQTTRCFLEIAGKDSRCSLCAAD